MSGPLGAAAAGFLAGAWTSSWRAPSRLSAPEAAPGGWDPRGKAPARAPPGSVGADRPAPRPAGQRVHADQDPGRLLLLRVGPARVPAHPRPQLREDGAGHLRGHQVGAPDGPGRRGLALRRAWRGAPRPRFADEETEFRGEGGWPGALSCLCPPHWDCEAQSASEAQSWGTGAGQLGSPPPSTESRRQQEALTDLGADSEASCASCCL